MKKIFLIAALSSSFVSLNAHAALFSLSGNHRFGGNWFYNLDTIDGQNPGASDSAGFLEHRLIVRPDIIVDERFSIRSEFSLISQNTYDSFASSVNQYNGGAGVDSHERTKSPATQSLMVRSAYLKWNSDIGVFRLGRMHKGWGLGLLFDEGNNVEDDAATIVDRMSYEGQLGSLVLTAAFEKYEEGSFYTDIDDDEVYEGSVKYENESAGVGIGLLYDRHLRMENSDSKQTQHYNSSNDFSFYAKKDWESFSIGGEFSSVAYDKQSEVYGGLGKIRWSPGNWDLQFDGVYSSASGDKAFIVHPNYRPLLILFRQNLGDNVGANNTRFGRGIGYDPGDPTATETGAMLGTLGAFYNFSHKKYRLGLIAGYGQMMKAGSSTTTDTTVTPPVTTTSAPRGRKLGFEGDLNFEQKWYDNFKTGLIVGVLKPGDAFPGQKLVFGVQVRSYLTF